LPTSFSPPNMSFYSLELSDRDNPLARSPRRKRLLQIVF
jgi:hypothetical protein